MSTDTATITPTPAARRGRRALAVAAAAVAGLAGWVLADPVAGIELAVDSGGEVRQIGWAAAATAGGSAALGAWAVLALLERWTARARRWFTVVALLVLALSLTGPLAATGASVAAVLVALHLGVAAIIILVLPAR